jgi:hypothetical protein
LPSKVVPNCVTDGDFVHSYRRPLSGRLEGGSPSRKMRARCRATRRRECGAASRPTVDPDSVRSAGGSRSSRPRRASAGDRPRRSRPATTCVCRCRGRVKRLESCLMRCASHHDLSLAAKGGRRTSLTLSGPLRMTTPWGPLRSTRKIVTSGDNQQLTFLLLSSEPVVYPGQPNLPKGNISLVAEPYPSICQGLHPRHR